MAARFGRVQKATALVPLALLSTAWTASLAGTGGLATVSAEAPGAPAATLPDGTTVPQQPIDEAASLTAPGVVALGMPAGRAGAADVVSTATTNDIPAAALAAYQRAATVIDAADKSCNLRWELLAAIGRVESDHGRFGGNALDDEGLARPGIYGIALDGSNDTAAIRDTDAGQYDNDGVWDRAVGPMQFIPSTWSVVGVDADGDGTRDPQDIDDAALASAVYLCSGDDDLSTVEGQRSAVFRYNRSNAYVDLVLSLMRAYMVGDFSAVPNGTTSAAFFVPDVVGPAGAAGQGGDRGGDRGPDRDRPRGGQPAGGGGGEQSSGGGSPAPPSGGGSGSDSDGGDPGGELDPTPEPPSTPTTKSPVDTVKEKVDGAVKDPGGTGKEVLEDPTKPLQDTVEGGISLAQAQAQCVGSLDLAKCVDELMNP